MNSLLIRTINIFTFYELVGVLAPLLIIIVAAVYTAHKTTRNKTIVALFFTQPILFSITYIFGTYIAEQIAQPIRNGYLQVGFFIGTIIVMLNLVIYSIEYVRGMREQNFDPDRVNRRQFASTIDTGLLLLILGASFGFFSPPELGQVILVCVVATILTIAITYLSIIRFIRDE